MKISYNWLKELVDFDFSPSELAENLTLLGFEVEEVVERGLNYPGVVVGKVLKKEKHPNADKLSVCQVTIGGMEELTIICGAANVAAGQIVPVATVGAELPGGFKIRAAKIRGMESRGMICSQQELGLEEKSEGIWVLPDQLSVGEPLADALNYETDYMIDISVTPNRPDALSHIGFAREVAAIAGTSLHLPAPEFREISERAADHVQVEIHCPKSCPRYAARLIRNVRIGPSPHWMVQRLETVGMRSINNIVDITNYVLMETGHPLHAFDYDLLAGGKIVVRESRTGEKFVTLDDKEHELQDGTVLICDGEKPVALGGIMGGLNSEVNESTTNILLESAYFLPESIQQSLRYLGINSEAAQRFERGADPNGVLYAQQRATQLMVELAGGEVYQGVVDNYPVEIHPVAVDLKPDQINKLLGTGLSREEMVELLGKVELKVEGDKVIAPTFRPDLRRTADIAEEVGRLFGYDNIPFSKASPLPYTNVFNEFDDYIDQLKTIMTGVGFQEVITNSMISSSLWEKLTGKSIYPLLNPISSDMDGMRNTLIPSLLEVIQWNLNRQLRDMAIFEIGRVFYHPGDLKQQPKEEIHLGIALAGKPQGEAWWSDRRQFDYYDIKGLIEYFADKISLDKLRFIPYDNFAVQNQAVKILADDREIGYLGQLHRTLQRQFDIETPVYVAELKIDDIFSMTRRSRRYEEIAKFPWVERDLAVIIDQQEEADKLINVIQNVGGKFLKKAFVFDIYTGKQVESGKKSVAFRLVFQSAEKTLTENEVSQAVARILKALEKRFKARLRS